MSEQLKVGDRVKVVVEGEIEQTMSDFPQYVVIEGWRYDTERTGVTVERIMPPMPEDRILYTDLGGAYAPIPNDVDWRNLVSGNPVSTETITLMWNKGLLTTERPA